MAIEFNNVIVIDRKAFLDKAISKARLSTSLDFFCRDTEEDVLETRGLQLQINATYCNKYYEILSLLESSREASS